MEKKEAILIIMRAIQELESMQPKGTGIRIRKSRGTIIDRNRVSGYEIGIDVDSSVDTVITRNVINENECPILLAMLDKFLSEMKKGPKVQKNALRRIVDQIINRWPDLLASTLVAAMRALISE
jgi:parallel beta-helix repeat protein